MAVSTYTRKCVAILVHRLVALAVKLFGLTVFAVKANPAPLWLGNCTAPGTLEMIARKVIFAAFLTPNLSVGWTSLFFAWSQNL